jgi:hypothetical protein
VSTRFLLAPRLFSSAMIASISSSRSFMKCDRLRDDCAGVAKEIHSDESGKSTDKFCGQVGA